MVLLVCGLWLFPAAWARVLAWIVLALIAFTLYFFRDPVRETPPQRELMVAPADGRVTQVDVCEESPFGLGRMKRVGIFLSVLDVHINRMPVAGTVERVHYRRGLFLDARHPESGERNESMAWHVRAEQGDVVVKQITGLIARRIIPWAKVGDALPKGARFGMIRFGSRTELYVPMECEILVREGDRVLGGLTLVARWV